MSFAILDAFITKKLYIEAHLSSKIALPLVTVASFNSTVSIKKEIPPIWISTD